jgi:hypothetical protein
MMGQSERQLEIRSFLLEQWLYACKKQKLATGLTVVDTVGTDMANNIVFLPSVGVYGGILIVTLECFFSL